MTDEIIKYTLGDFGEEASLGVEEEIREIIMDRPRAKDLAAREHHEPTVEELRESFGGGISDEELLLRYAVGGDADVKAMREAGPIKEYSLQGRPVVDIVASIAQREDLNRVSINEPGFSLVVEGRKSMNGSRRH